MKKLISLPANLVSHFHQIEGKNKKDWFCSSDPIETHLGSGGGTSWLLKENWEYDKDQDFNKWLNKEKRILIHAGGQSKRLPAYASSGKILTPIPVFRWERGQRIDQNLLDLQVPLYEKILKKSPKRLNTLIASGDVYIRSEGTIDELPDVDIVCYGLWVNAELASNHGVFICNKNNPEELIYMLQKPSVSQLQELAQDQLYLMDIGIWVLSDRAVKVLMKHSGYDIDKDGKPNFEKSLPFYDLYGDFGVRMGQDENNVDSDINQLKVAIVSLPRGEFYHYGTSKELISSTLSIQNRIKDQRSILHKDSKPHPSIFVQNAEVDIDLHHDQRNLWIENSYISSGWQIDSEHIITGIPNNDWNLKLAKGICIDIIPINEEEYCLRPYGFHDTFKGVVDSSETKWLGDTFSDWLSARNLKLSDLSSTENTDIQLADIFPVMKLNEINDSLISWMIAPSQNDEIAKQYLASKRISAHQIIDQANLNRLYEQRGVLRNSNYSLLHKNYKKSVFYQIDLDDMAKRVAHNGIQIPVVSPDDPLLQMHEYMFRAKVKQYLKKEYEDEEQKAFEILQESIIKTLPSSDLQPRLSTFKDQIVWGRSPIRIDVAGGWSDTPPYSLIHGGAVVNMAIELNGQPPLQVFIKPSNEFKIILRSIDIGIREDVCTYEELRQFNQVGSAFSIAKAALFLAGFNHQYAKIGYKGLEEQLKEFGSGIEISTLAAIPKGSGLGTSSILAATILGALSDFCGLGWGQKEISHRTLVLEQLLTTGGGWQDQFGGVLPGIKLLHTEKGSNQTPQISWAPEFVFQRPENKACMLLYYTGITRTAKNILSEIVRGMFLNESVNTEILREIKQHAFDTFEILQQGNFNKFSKCINHTWEQKKQLDSGTNPPEVQKLIAVFKDYASAYKLPGAGGGGYMYIIAKDPEAAGKIRSLLNNNPPNERARFVDLDLSQTGFQVTRS